MPQIAAFNGIKIYVYSKEHVPPCFHAIYAEFEVLLLIDMNLAQLEQCVVVYLSSVDLCS